MKQYLEVFKYKKMASFSYHLSFATSVFLTFICLIVCFALFKLALHAFSSILTHAKQLWTFLMQGFCQDKSTLVLEKAKLSGSISSRSVGCMTNVQLSQKELHKISGLKSKEE